MKFSGDKKLSSEKALLIGQLPPPLHGASYLNKVAFEEIEKHYKCKTIILNQNKSLESLGRVSFDKLIFVLTTFFSLFKYLVSNRPKFAYFTANVSGGAFYRDFLISLILKSFRVKLIYHLHGLGVQEKCDTILGRIILGIMFRNSKVICVSELVASSEFQGVEFHNVDVSFVSNGIDISKVDYLGLTTESKKMNTLTLLHMSNLRESKGILDLLQVASELKLSGIELVVKIAGDFRDRSFEQKCKNFITKNGLEQCVQFVGNLGEKDKYEFLASSGVFVYPTYRDSFGLVVIESMAVGTPVVAYNEGSLAEILDNGKSGLVVEKGNKKEMLNKIVQLFEDQELYNSIRISGFQRISNEYSLSSFRGKLIRVISR